LSLQIFTIKVGINRCYIVKDEGTILIDAGSPNKIHIFQKAFKRLKMHPPEIRLIILSHGDFDHVGSVKDIKEITGAKIVIHEHDRHNLEQSRFNFPPGVTRWGRLSRAIMYPFLKNLITFPSTKADIVLNENDFSISKFGINGTIIYTPGHTEGSVSVLLETGEAFVVCLAHNNLPFRLQPGLPIYAKDINKLRESWDLIIKRGARMIYPAHGNPFSVDVMKNSLKN